jgi:hypothetical protein
MKLSLALALLTTETVVASLADFFALTADDRTKTAPSSSTSQSSVSFQQRRTIWQRQKRRLQHQNQNQQKPRHQRNQEEGDASRVLKNIDDINLSNHRQDDQHQSQQQLQQQKAKERRASSIERTQRRQRRNHNRRRRHRRRQKQRRSARHLLVETHDDQNQQRRGLNQYSPSLRLVEENPTFHALCDPSSTVSSAATTASTIGDGTYKKNMNIEPDVGVLSCGLGLYCQPDPTSKLGGICVPSLKNRKKSNNHWHQQDQQQYERIRTGNDNNDIEADVGILRATRNGKTFIKGRNVGHQSYSQLHPPQQQRLVLDMVDYSSRRLEDYIDAPTDDGDVFAMLNETYCNNATFVCTSCSLDVEAYTGNIDCTFQEPCQVLEDEFCGTGTISEICYNSRTLYSFDYTFLNDTLCYGYVTDLNKINFTYCLSYSYDSENESTSCEITIGDDVCTSCEIATTANVGDDGNETELLIFDCENTLLGISGNESEYPFVASVLLDYDIAYYFTPCSDGCNACGRGRGMLEPDAIFQLPSGDDQSCDVLQEAYLTGVRGPGGDDSCDNFVPTQLAYETCQCYGFGVPAIDPTEFSTFSPTTTSYTYPPTSSPADDFTTFPPATSPIDEGPGPTLIDYLNGVCTIHPSNFNCTSCDVDVEQFTANVSCKYIKICEDSSASQCDTGDPVSMCTHGNVDVMVRSAEDYQSYVCNEISTRDFDYQFSYCLSYDKSTGSSPSSCKMSVNGIECTSCDVSKENGDGGDTCYLFDCTNTVVGYAGSTCTSDLISRMETYFIYKLLPCEDGCSLCSDDKETMTNGSQSFRYNNEELNCFESQLSALLGPTDASFCVGARPAASEVCGCQDTTTIPSPPPAPPSGSSESSIILVPTTKGKFLSVAAAIGTGVAVANAFI